MGVPSFPIASPGAVVRDRGTAGFSTVQALMAMAIVIIAGLASIEALVLTNHKAATMRTLNNARAVVQQRIDTALGVPFTSASPPSILNLGTTTETDVPIVVKRNGTDSVVKGTLTRTVTSEALGGDIRRITVSLSYKYRSPRFTTVTMTTLRSTD